MMEAMKYFKKMKRMCEYYAGNCKNCPLYNKYCTYDCLCDCSDTKLEESISIVEQWSKGHPVKTRQDKFLEIYPNAKLDDNNVLMVSPYDVDKTIKSIYICKNCKYGGFVGDCRKIYWGEEVEGEE